MAKKVPNLVLGPGFLMFDRPKSSPRSVSPEFRAVSGQEFLVPNSGVVKFASEGQLADILAARIDVTVGKYMFAVAQLFAEGGPSLPVTVEGAKLTYTTGHSSIVSGANGETFFSGIQQAHYGISTVTRNGEALNWISAFLRIGRQLSTEEHESE